MYTLRILRKGLSLRIVNLIGLTVTIVSLILSINYIRRERSYDRHHSKADRIIRLSLQEEGQSMDVRIWGKMIYPLLEEMPEIEKCAIFHNSYATDMEYKGRHISKHENVLFVNDEFFDVFDIQFIENEQYEGDHIYLSESYASYLAAETSEESLVGKEITFNTEPTYVAGTFKDFPETSHFRADILVCSSIFGQENWYTYMYLLTREGTDIKSLEGKITDAVTESGIYSTPAKAFLMPLTDIHLHSNFIRELDNNGNVLYIYLIICANILLLIIVLFNLCLNRSLILIENEKRHRINWVLGAPRSHWLMSVARWMNMNFGKSAKYIFIMQYAIVMLILVMSVGMGRQMRMVSRIQPGGDSVVVMNLPSDENIMKNLDVFKSVLLESPDIKGVTSTFLLPGNAIRDYITISVDCMDESVKLPMFVTGEDFLPFFDLELIAGNGFTPLSVDYETEYNMMLWRLYDGTIADRSEEYIINESALSLLGFEDASEAIGREVRLEEHGTVDYINRGTIVGVIKDFYYTGTLNRTEPLIMMQRQNFQHCVLIDLADIEAGTEHIGKSWDEAFPGYVMTERQFMNDIYSEIYSDEIQAVTLMRAFALICFIITDLGLIVFMAYIVKRRRREIALRKVNGATRGDIVAMLNISYIKYIQIAFAAAIPLAWFILDRWLQRFAYRISPDWSIFVLAGLTILLISIASVSFQSLRAASVNPIEGIRE